MASGLVPNTVSTFTSILFDYTMKAAAFIVDGVLSLCGDAITLRQRQSVRPQSPT